MVQSPCPATGAMLLPERLFYLADANYNVTSVVRENPASPGEWHVVERYVYDPHGRVAVLNGDPAGDPDGLAAPDVYPAWSADPDGRSDRANTTLYIGRELDRETGLYHVRHRMYHATLSTWTSRDPSEYESGDSNLYRYVHNSPTSRLDPSGLSDLDETTDPSQLREKEIVIFLGHFVPSDLTQLTGQARADAVNLREFDEIEKALKRMAANTTRPPKDAYVAVVGCFQPAAKRVVDELFPGKWLEGPPYVKKDRLTNAAEDVRIALQAYRLAKQKKGYTLSVYADQEFRDAIESRIDCLTRKNQQRFDQQRAKEINDLGELLNVARQPRAGR